MTEKRVHENVEVFTLDGGVLGKALFERIKRHEGERDSCPNALCRCLWHRSADPPQNKK